LGAMLGGAGAPPLCLCHRLDKETTGVMVLARGAEAAARVRLLFKERRVEKVYWAIALGQPEPTEGVVDIPVVEKEVQGGQAHFKMTLAPNYRLDREAGKEVKIRKARGAESAVTRYRVLAAASGCSLLELQPITGKRRRRRSRCVPLPTGSGDVSPLPGAGVKHQIRVHLAYGLGCPILGDHKYSHWRKLAPQVSARRRARLPRRPLRSPARSRPQKLPEVTLKRLKLEQAKARHLPLHLHARRLSLPPGTGAAPLELLCQPPAFFRNTLRRLKLEPAEA
ncbi:RUSD4 synthase, partial [Nothocercus nigrocapillus]|nr:RUSD4 synthase [Nothocercus nigrocapillus]